MEQIKDRRSQSEGSQSEGSQSEGSQSEGSLQGLVVLDVSRVLAGPYCSMMLADLGADVIKIERPPSGDDTRAWGPPYLGDPDSGLSAYFLSVNRGKRSVCIDLKRAAGRELFFQLLSRADVLIENFAPGVADRLGLHSAGIAEANPEIIHCSITGFGDQPGPAYDLVVQGMSGLMSITGTVDGPPLKVGVAITDVVAGLQASTAILAAVAARQRTGRGDRINVSLLSSAVASLVNVGQAYLVSGEQPARWGNAHPQIVPYQVFASADGYFTVAAGNDKLFASLCRVIGRPELATDARYASNPQRVANRKELVTLLEQDFARQRTAAWLSELAAANVPCGPVLDLPGLFQAESVPGGVPRRQFETACGQTYQSVGPAVQMTGLKRDISAAPLVGEHTVSILGELADCDSSRLQQLRDDGVIR